jgi:hypothetical protein
MRWYADTKELIPVEFQRSFRMSVIMRCSHDVRGMKTYRAAMSVSLFAWLNSTTDWRILIKFSMDIIPFEATVYFYF